MNLLLTGYDAAMAPIGDLTSPLMLTYASKHGMDFLCVRNYPKDVPAYWGKVTAILNAFKNGYDSVMWLDADQVITNSDFYFHSQSGFHASLDWGVDAVDDSFFSMCGFVIHQDAKFLLEWVYDNWLQYIDWDFPEQAPMRHLHRESKRARNMMGICTRRVFNAVPMEIGEGVIDPWRAGDFCCHLTHVPVERRVELFYEIKNQIS